MRKATDRRAFLRRGGAMVAVFGGAAACSELEVGPLAPAGSSSLADVSLGTGDTAVLNYAYALEQLEAAFYDQVIATPYAGITGVEFRTLHDIRDHEHIHREFFRAALGSARIQDLGVNFSAINFASRESVLTTARTFEDLGVAAYNGAGQLLSNVDFLLAAGKIVSVEARHASAVRLMISEYLLNTGYSPTTAGSDIVDAQGLDRAMTPNEVLAAAGPFLTDRIIATGLPTS